MPTLSSIIPPINLSSVSGTIAVSNGGTGATSLTGVVKGTGASALTAGTVSLTTEVSGTLLVANGGTGATTLTANNVLLGNGTSELQTVAPGASGNVLTSNGTTWVSSAFSSAVSYPQNIKSTNYTLVLSDAGKQIFHPASDTSSRTYTIPANSSVPFPIGTVLLFTVENGGVYVNVAITSDTLVLGDGTTGTIFVAPNNTLMCVKVSATKWMANYLYQTGSAFVPTQTLAVAFDSAGVTVAAYPWSNSGFGTRYADPASPTVTTGRGVAFSPTGDAIAVANYSSPYIHAYRWSSSGFGTKFTNPASLPVDACNGVAFSPAGDAIAVVHFTSPYVTAYPWSSSGFGTKYANPASPPPNTGFGVAFSPAGDAIAVAHNSSPFISAYPWSSSGFGTRYANPATLPTSASRAWGVAFHPTGNAIAVAADGVTPNNFLAFRWSSSGFGTKYADPSTLIGAGNGVAFNQVGNAIAVGHQSSPYINVYPWSSSGFGTKFANPASLPSTTSGVYSVAFTINP